MSMIALIIQRNWLAARVLTGKYTSVSILSISYIYIFIHIDTQPDYQHVFQLSILEAKSLESASLNSHLLLPPRLLVVMGSTFTILIMTRLGIVQHVRMMHPCHFLTRMIGPITVPRRHVAPEPMVVNLPMLACVM